MAAIQPQGPTTVPRRRQRRSLRVVVLYCLAVLREFRWTLAAIAAVVLIGGALYAITPHAALGGRRPDLWTALYCGWMALLAQSIFNPPETWSLTLVSGV